MNREQKNLIIMLAACSQTLSEFETNKLFKPHLKWLRSANTFLLKVLDGIMDNVLDKGEFQKLYNYSKETHIEVHPNAQVVSKDYVFISRDVLDDLTQSSMMGCALCMKSKYEIKNCKIKKALDHVGVEERGGIDCPYKLI